LHSLQTIAADGKKNFLSGGHVTGCFFMLGEPDGTLCIAEGFATGASVFECTGIAVAVAFNSGNLLPVVRALRPRFPDMRLIVCADDDIKTLGNPGMRDGRKAAQAVGASLAAPDFGSNRPEDVSDFNDLRQCAGLDAVRACIEKAAPFNGLEAGAAAESEPCEIDGKLRVWQSSARLTTSESERTRRPN
jgi:putative DNA primase/helicase